MQGFSPVKLEVVIVEKLKHWRRENKSGQIAHVYARLINEMPDFPLYFVLFAPSTVRIAPGVSLYVPISGIRITLGDDSLASSPFPFDFDNQASKKIP